VKAGIQKLSGFSTGVFDYHETQGLKRNFYSTVGPDEHLGFIEQKNLDSGESG